jgi:hypothetical protein
MDRVPSLLPEVPCGARRAYSPVPITQNSAQNHSEQTALILSRIEDTIEDIIDAIQENRPLSICLRNSTGGRTEVSFPSDSNSGSKRFSRFYRTFHHLPFPFPSL